MSSTIRAVIVACLMLAPLAAHQQADVGAIGGRVTDEAGAPLPGVRVTAITAATAREVSSDVGGRFVISGLPAGSYRVRAELNSFRAGTIERVDVRAGASTEIKITMRPGIITDADYAAPAGGVAGAMREADEVLHVRVRSIIGSGPLGRDARIVGTQYEAVVLETIKAGAAARAPESLVKFWQHDAGRVVEEGRSYLGQFRVIAPGESVIVLLRKDPAAGLDTYADKRCLYSTAKGVIMSLSPPSTDGRVPNGTPVDKAIEILRGLVK